MKRFVYHYCIKATDPNQTKIYTIDGIAQMENKIQTMEEYQFLKKFILDDYPIMKDYSVSMTSLSFIGMED